MGRFRECGYGNITIKYNYVEKMIYLIDHSNAFRCRLSKDKLDAFVSILILLGDGEDESTDMGHICHTHIYFGTNRYEVNDFDRNQIEFIDTYRTDGKIIGNYFNIYRRDKMLSALKSFFRRKKFELILPDDITKIPLKILIQMRNKKCQLLELKS